jgi:hypothetical protein
MPEADATGCGGTESHQAGKADTLFCDLADHDALQARSVRVPERIDRMFTVRIFLTGGVVLDLLSASERADHAEAVHTAGKFEILTFFFECTRRRGALMIGNPWASR